MSEFNVDEINLLKEFFTYCYETTLDHEQRTTSWSQSYWTYEVLQNLVLGEELYKWVPVPYWLVTKPKYRQHEQMLKYGKFKRLMFSKLKEIKDQANNLIVCEVGYGVDIIIAMMVKEWDEILCYDINGLFEDIINGFFVEKHHLNIKFEETNSAYFRFDEAKENTIVISNNTHISVGTPSERIRNNENLIYLRDGEIIDKSEMPRTTEECRKSLGRGWF